MASSKIDDLIQEFATKLRAAIAEEAAAAFAQVAGGGSRTAAKPARVGGRPAKAAGGSADGGRIRRSPEDLAKQAALILGYVKKNPGQRAEQIGAGIGLSSREMMVPMAKL